MLCFTGRSAMSSAARFDSFWCARGGSRSRLWLCRPARPTRARLSVVVASREHRSIVQDPIGTAGIRLTTVFSLASRLLPFGRNEPTTRSSNSQSGCLVAYYRFRSRATGHSASIGFGRSQYRFWYYWPSFLVNLASDLSPLIVKHAPRLSGHGSLLELRHPLPVCLFVGIVLIRAWAWRRSLSQAQSPLEPVSALLRGRQPLYTCVSQQCQIVLMTDCLEFDIKRNVQPRQCHTRENRRF